MPEHSLTRSHILAVGAGWIAINKPAGLSVHNAQPSTLTPDLITLASALIQDDASLRAELKLQNPWSIHPVHRLDSPTSGVILLALEPARARQLADAFAARTAFKSYVAVLKGPLTSTPQDWNEWTWPLTDKAEGRRNPQGTGEKQQALTRYQVSANNSYFSLVNIELRTGRQHQIRRHAALAKHQVIGDLRYGDPEYQHKIEKWYAFDRLALHARELRIDLGVEKINVHAPVHQSFAKLIEHDMI